MATAFKIEELSGAAALETRLNELRNLKTDPYLIIGDVTLAILERVGSFKSHALINISITSDIIKT